MKIAFDLAEKGRGRTSPNPLVGAVLVKNDEIIGQGYHQKAGEPHAEILALRSANVDIKGSKLYVTLEPCCTIGRTPACTDAIIAAGISEVVVGALDPNPKINGKSIEILKKAGMKVRINQDFTSLINKQNEIFIKNITTNKPFVLFKMAASLDGMITAQTGTGTNITGDKAKLKVYSLRDEYDAVMIGVNTAIYDDPLLTARVKDGEGRNPIRIILDSHAKLPLKSKLASTASEIPTFVLTLPEADPIKIEKLRALGVNVIFAKNDNGRIDLNDCIDWAAGFDIMSIMVEGGSKLFTSFIKADLIDKYIFFIAPIIIGGKTGVRLMESKEMFLKKLEFCNYKKIGGDIYFEAYPKN